MLQDCVDEVIEWYTDSKIAKNKTKQNKNPFHNWEGFWYKEGMHLSGAKISDHRQKKKKVFPFLLIMLVFFFLSVNEEIRKNNLQQREQQGV